MNLFLRMTLILSGITSLMSASATAAPMQNINPGVAREAAECFAWAGQRVDCFARTFGNGLSAVFADSEKWNLPRNLGGDLAAAPSCVSRGPRSISCFAATDSGLLATIELEGSAWGRWSSLGGSLAPSRVSCVTFGSQRISCHARGAGGQFLERIRQNDGSWGQWRSFGAVFSADPVCLEIAEGRDACFGRGAQGDFVALVPDEEPSLRMEISIKGEVEGRPSCVAEGGGVVSCVIMQTSGGFALWRGQATGASTDGALVHIDVETTSEPSCFARDNGLTCGWRNARSELSAARISQDGQHTDIEVPALGRVAGVKCLSLVSGSPACIVTGTDKSLRYVSLASTPRALPEKAMPLALPSPPADSDDLEGAWVLSEISSGASCRVSLLRAEGTKPGVIRFAPGCHAITLPQGLATWKRDLGSLRVAGADTGHALHFSPLADGQWMSPTQSSAVMLTRLKAHETSPPALQRNRSKAARSTRRGRGRAHL